jgi:hypothetical protein
MFRSLVVVLSILSLFAVLPQAALAQYLPLHLDQSITLPAQDSLWDVMPHPDGYYLWVQAFQPTSLVTRIYWGRTDLGNRDSIDLSVGNPHAITCFWRNNHIPYVILASYPNPNAYPPFTADLNYHMYRLPEGIPDSVTVGWSGFYQPNMPPFEGGAWGAYFKSLVTALNPTPPQISTQVLVAVKYEYHSSWSDNGYESAQLKNPCVSILNMLSSDSIRATGLSGDGQFAAWCTGGNDIRIVYSGTESSSNSGPAHTDYSYLSSVHYLRTNASSILSNDSVWSCSANTAGVCDANNLAITVNTSNNRIIYFTRTNNTYVCRSNASTSPLWSTSGPYQYWLAAECISGNSTEEFLAYNSTRRVFDVFNAADGHYFGITDSIVFEPYEAKVVGRYDSTSRRLAVHRGGHLNLYTFGQYLGADDPSVILHPSSFILSAYPNPFNPACTISFDLPQTGEVAMKVYDITGRFATDLVHTVYPAGEHHITFDGSQLPSGIYFARMDYAGTTQTHKLLLLK